MLVYNWTTQEKSSISECVRGIVNIYDDVCELGYFSSGCHTLVHYNGHTYHLFNDDLLKYCYFDGNLGVYILKEPFKTGRKDTNLKLGRGGFPYSFKQMYEAVHNFKFFKNKQQLVNKEIMYNYSDLLDYTFGLEFETSSGYIPENICFRDGLIPLRDGSITGVEYSTTVLKGNKGLNFLHQQIDTLGKYTRFDKECSLHIHMGTNYLNNKLVWNLYIILILFQNELVYYTPAWTFESHRYKRTGKNYCSKLPLMSSFDQLFKFVAGKPFEGSLTDPHVSDPDRTHKWQVKSRYFAFNFVNLVSYKNPKTIEFRFLRPTYNFYEIETWLFIFTAMLKLAEKYANQITDNHESAFMFYKEKFGERNMLFRMLKDVYPNSLAENLISRLKILNNATTVLTNNSDFYCSNPEIKESYLNKTFFNSTL